MEAGADGIRINPGNIGGKDRLREVVRVAKGAVRSHPDRGQFRIRGEDPSRQVWRGYAEAMVTSALQAVAEMEEMGFRLIKVSLKASDIPRTLEAYRLFFSEIGLPPPPRDHRGRKGPGALIKSAIGIGLLLHEGIGDTLRVSLTGDPSRRFKRDLTFCGR